MRKITVPTCDSLIIMAQNVRPRKARQDTLRLKAQRDEKRKKDELALEANIGKASEEQLRALFR